MSGLVADSDNTASANRYSALRSRCHPDCVACRDRHEGGLGLHFDLRADNAVAARFFCAPEYQGYPDRLHGGIIATLLDAAMTHCLFARHCRGVTAKLSIRYLRPVLIGVEATICATVLRERGLLFELSAELQQVGAVCASAQGTFIGDVVSKD